MPIKKRDFERVTIKKGYLQIRKGDHIFYRFKDNEGKIVDSIHTKVSHGGTGDISDSLLSKMYKQMMFTKKTDLENYIACTLTEDEYRDMLRSKGFIV
ncbi:hypothetical protein [Methanocalculus sp.]|uniref:hypothetical protein n=1 Tax=Methanocalculus sp. TaxID=2004547 RepID=UPI00271ACDC1|nr:hypothetical protein [Methanocalculus sp.]MDO8841827.1 hypothetical protein [Methanocalculus sp.]